MAEASGENKDPALELLARYFEWNDRIFERFFPLAPDRPLRILAFDSSELRSIAGEIGHPSNTLIAAVRELVDPNAHDPFGWWSPTPRQTWLDRNPPYYVALLAIFSLAASKSGDPISDRQRAFFHRQLADLIGLGEIAFVPGFRNATNLYYRFKDYLDLTCGGDRGTLLVPTTAFGGKYVWRARVQVLLNASSRRQLAFYFDHRCANLGELRGTDLRVGLMNELGRQDYALSPALKRTLELVASEGGEILEGFFNLVEIEYVRWFLSQKQTRRTNQRTSQASPSTVQAPPSPENHAITHVAAAQSKSRRKRAHREVYEKRLVLRPQLGVRPWELHVQTRKAGGDWLLAHRVQLEWATGTITYELSDETHGTLPIDDLTTFANDGVGWVAAKQLRAGDLCAVLCSQYDAERLVGAFDELPGANPVIRPCAGAPDAAIVVAHAPRATASAIPPSLRYLLAEDTARLTFRRGLRTGAQYFETASPRVFYDHPTIVVTPIILDGQIMPEPIHRRVEYSLRQDLSLGRHTVEVLGIAKSFTLCDQSIVSRMDPWDCSGFDVCYACGVAIPTKSPGSAQTDEYKNLRVHVIVGGLIL